MAVQLTILSGARQGEQLTCDAERFSLGDGDCTIGFDAAEDAGAGGQRLELALGNEGWTIRNPTRQEAFVNGVPISGSNRLRSGDVLGLSAAGPELSFEIIARAAPGVTVVRPPLRPRAKSPPPIPTAEQPPVLQEAPRAARPAVVMLTEVEPVGVGGGLPTYERVGASVPRPASGGVPAWFWAILAGSILAATLCGLVIFASSQLFSGEESKSAVAAAAAPKGDASAANVEAAKKIQPFDPSPNSATTAGAEPSPLNPAPPPADRTEPAAEADSPFTMPKSEPAASDKGLTVGELTPAIVLLAVEKAEIGATWPFATAVAVRPDTLLTAGTVAAELANFRAAGSTLWVIDGAAEKRAVRSLRVAKPFVQLASDRGKQVFFDVAIVRIEGRMAGVVRASATAAANLERGQPLRLGLMVHEGEALNKFNAPQLELAEARLFLTSPLGGDPSAPRLIHLKGDVPKHAFGAAVLTTAGELVGVYSDAASNPEGQSLKLHYAPAVDARLLDEWLADDEMWVEPPVRKPEAKPAGKAGGGLAR